MQFTNLLKIKMTEDLPKTKLLDLVMFNLPMCVIKSDAECQKWLEKVRMEVYKLNNLTYEEDNKNLNQ